MGESVADAQGATLIEAAYAAAPDGARGIVAGLARAGDRLALTVSGEALSGGAETIRNLFFFPYEGA